MSTAKALDTQQRKLLGSARGLTGMMRLAALAADSLNRSMLAFDAQASERLNRSFERMERAVGRLADPVEDAAAGLAGMNNAILEASGRMAGLSRHLGAMQLTVRAAATAVGPGSAAAGTPVKQDEKKLLEEKVKKDVIPSFVKFGELMAGVLPILQLDKKEKKANEEHKCCEQQAKALEALQGEGAVANPAVKATETAQGTAQIAKAAEAMQGAAAVQARERQAAKSVEGVEHAAQVDKAAESATAMYKRSAHAAKAAQGAIQATQAAEAVKGVAVMKARGQQVAKTATNESSAKQAAAKSAKASEEVAQAEKNAKAADAVHQQAARTGTVEASLAQAANATKTEASAVVPGAGATAGQSVSAGTALPNLKEQVAGLTQAYSTFMTQNAAVSDFIVANWGQFESIYKGVNAAISAYNALQLISRAYTVFTTAAQYAQTLVTMGLRNAWAAMNATMKANVIILIISVIAGLIAAIISLWKTNDQFAAFFIRAWNWILGLFDKVPIVVLGMIESVFTAFKRFSEIISQFVANFLKQFEGFVMLYNAITGKEVTIPTALEIEEWSSRGLRVVSGLKVAVEERAANRAAKREDELAEFLKKREDARNKEEQAANAQDANAPAYTGAEAVVVGGGRLDEVGRVNDTVDISSEDLKTMRELAEMKNIQNFVTLTPSVNVQTGDIRNGMDVSSMVQAITAALQEEIAGSAEGVYA